MDPLPFWQILNLYTVRLGFVRWGTYNFWISYPGLSCPPLLDLTSPLPTLLPPSVFVIIFEELPFRQLSLQVTWFKVIGKGVNNAINIWFVYSCSSRPLEQCLDTELMLNKYCWTQSWHHIIMSWAPHNHSHTLDRCPQSFSSLLPPHSMPNHYSQLIFLPSVWFLS